MPHVWKHLDGTPQQNTGLDLRNQDIFSLPNIRIKQFC
jgi:hypothetical protein